MLLVIAIEVLKTGAAYKGKSEVLVECEVEMAVFEGKKRRYLVSL